MYQVKSVQPADEGGGGGVQGKIIKTTAKSVDLFQYNPSIVCFHDGSEPFRQIHSHEQHGLRYSSVLSDKHWNTGKKPHFE